MAATIKTYVNNSPPQCSAEDLNGFEQENNLLITSSGQSLDPNDHTQTSKAVACYSTVGDYYIEGGSGNAYTLAPANDAGAMYAPTVYKGGMRVRFFATHTNSGPATLNLNSIGAKNIVTYAGSALLGGELVSGQYYELIMNADKTAFVMQTHSDEPVGHLRPYAGFTAPPGYLLIDTNPVSRTTYSVLHATITFTKTGNVTSGSPIITNLASTSNLYVGMQLNSANFSGTVDIISVDSGTQITVSANATSTGTGITLRFYPWGAGDGSSTFNLPSTPSRDIMGAGAGAGLTARLPGQLVGAEGEAPDLTQLTPHFHTFSGGNPVGGSGPAWAGAGPYNPNSTDTVGGGQPFNIISPKVVMNYIIKY